MGTFGWTLAGASDPRAADDGDNGAWWREEEGSTAVVSPRGAHFDPRNFSSLGPRISVEVSGIHRQRGIGTDHTQQVNGDLLIGESL